MIDQILNVYGEEVRNKEYVTAVYHMRLPVGDNALERAERMAVGQTVGTWIPVPGITGEIREHCMGKVVRVFDVPSSDLSTQIHGEERQYVVEIAYPAVNLSEDFPLLLTSLLGNDASTSAQVKLLDIEFPKEFAGRFCGPSFGVKGVRELLGIKERPLLLTMIKPCTGLKPKEGAKLFYQAALGGVDLIKDDELMGNMEYSRPWERVKYFQEAAEEAYEKTGKRPVYIVNVTDGAIRVRETIERVLDQGAEMIMLNYAVLGYSLFHEIAVNSPVPVLAHNAGAGIMYEGRYSGMSSPLAAAKLIRMAGADMVMVNTPYGGYPLEHQKYMQMLQKLLLPYYNIKTSFPVIGGGVHPGIVAHYMKEVGNDMVLAAGGAIFGHPGGAQAGAKAMGAAITSSLKNIPLEEAAKESMELKTALELWGIMDSRR